MHYIELDIKLQQVLPFAEILTARLNEIGFDAYLESETGLKAYIQTKLFDENRVKEIISDISDLTKISVSKNEMEQKNWNKYWEKSFDPVQINDKCVIRADFHSPFSNVDYEIIINPKMSFGTGHHQTTALMIDQMFELDFREKSVLDMGTGTGILAILASQLGSSNIVGIDSDKWAFENAIDNAQLNNITNINFIHGNSIDIPDIKFDVILANINRNVILKHITKYIELIGSCGDIVLSGFLKEDVPLITKILVNYDLQLIDLKNKNKWQMLHLRKF